MFRYVTAVDRLRPLTFILPIQTFKTISTSSMHPTVNQQLQKQWIHHIPHHVSFNGLFRPRTADLSFTYERRIDIISPSSRRREQNSQNRSELKKSGVLSIDALPI